MLRFDIITLFPEIFDVVSNYGVTSRAMSRGLATVQVKNLRDFTQDVHHTVDDRPYGGGPGMVMLPGPLTEAVTYSRQAQVEALGQSGPVVLLSPAGKTINQALIDRVAQGGAWTLVCGRYEGVDQRFIDQQVDELWSLGDFVLSGGEIAALAVIDAAIRRLPGALGDAQSSEQDSFVHGILDCPHYTRPEIFAGQAVPDVLLSGHHERIVGFRREMALTQTARFRPDLIAQARSTGQLTPKDEDFLARLSRSGSD
jgi:tRNA (guanine37-N1)-methyltransferase